MINVKYPAQSPLRELADQLPRNMRKAFRQRIERDVLPAFQDELIRRFVTETPPKRTRRSPKFVWSHNKEADNRARRWWFANIKKGNINTDGHNYIRTGKLQLQWRVFANVTTDAVTLNVINRGKGASYVWGTPGLYAQVPGHKRTGWPSAATELDKAVQGIDTEIGVVFDAIVDEVIG